MPTAATGLATFKDNGIIIGEWQLISGTASFSTSSLAYGVPHTLTVEYSGDANYRPSVSNRVIQTITIPNTGYRDFGAVRVWALNFFDHLDGTTTAFGSVFVGPKTLGDSGKYFNVGTQVDGISGTITGTNLITLTGRLSYLVGGQPLVDGI